MALELIIDGYVRLSDRRALAELKAHREDLLAQLRAQMGGWFDVSRSVSQMEEEIVQVEAGRCASCRRCSRHGSEPCDCLGSRLLIRGL